METKKIVLLSISSDIAFEVANDLLKKKFKIIGTYKTSSNKVSKLKKDGVKLFKLDLSNKKNIDLVAKKINYFTKKNWDYFISFAGQLNPIGKIIGTNSNNWERSIYVNSLGQLRLLSKILKRNAKRRVLFFSGSGTNGPKNNYSAYTLSKILLIKFVELLDSEEKKVIAGILGPGFIKTKIHKNKKIKTSKNEINKIKKIVNFIYWFFSQPKNIVGGRNFSLVSDKLESKKIIKLLKSNKDNFKLRRYGNNISL